ncbi:MAG: DDE transposase, partial [Actinobacteria bacterium]|nr:DDE transposase [Actinomycetota bacterium]
MIVNLKLPLTEITLPANIRDTSVIVSQLDAIKNNLSLKLKAVIAGSEYDSAAVLEYIAEIIGTKPRIAINPRRCVPSATKISSSGVSICIAGFELLSKGIFMYRAQNRKRHKFVCPIKRSKKFAKENPYCPWLHPSFVE